jgi:hypothetical protein
MPATSDDLHVPTVIETARHIKIPINVFLQNDRRKGSELLSAFDIINTFLYFRTTGICQQTSVAQGSGAKLCTTTGNTHNLIT